MIFFLHLGQILMALINLLLDHKCMQIYIKTIFLNFGIFPKAKVLFISHLQCLLLFFVDKITNERKSNL